VAEHYRQTIKLMPNMAAAHYGLGSAMAALGHPAAAKIHFGQAEELQSQLINRGENRANAIVLALTSGNRCQPDGIELRVGLMIIG
jgi:hypothetical protein